MKRGKIVLAFVVSILAVLLCACASNSGNNVPDGNSANDAMNGDVQTDAGNAIRVGLAMPCRDQYFSGLQTQLERACEEAGIEIVAIYEAGDYDVQKQLEQVATLATLDVDFIVGAICDTNNAEAVFESAPDIQQVWISRHPPTDVLEKYDYVTFAGSPERDAGLRQGEWLAEYFADKNKDTINYVLFMGPLGLENAMERTAGAKEALEEAGYTLNTVYEDTANWDRAEAMNKMQQVLAMGQEIDCVICNNDEMALGAIEALKAANMLEGIPVVGVDATVAGMTSIQQGEMAMTVLQNAAGQADAAIQNVLAIAAGEDVEKETWVAFEPVTPENVAEYMAAA